MLYSSKLAGEVGSEHIAAESLGGYGGVMKGSALWTGGKRIASVESCSRRFCSLFKLTIETCMVRVETSCTRDDAPSKKPGASLLNITESLER